jgi:TRAP-type uncharacterized transport system substrate-binding protein
VTAIRSRSGLLDPDPRDTIGVMTESPEPRSRFSRWIHALLVLGAILGAGIALALPAQAEKTDQDMVRIASGRAGFTYRSVYATNLQKLMRGYKFVYLKSEGSGQNLDLLADGKANVAFAQADAYAQKLESDPERYGKIMLVGRIAPECVYVARRKDGPITGLDALAAQAAAGKATVVVGDDGSGMSSTWSYLTQRVPGLAAVRVDHTKGTLALNQLAVGGFDAVGWVTDPSNGDQKMLRAVLANDALDLMPIKDETLMAPLKDGIRVYEPRTIEVGEGRRKTGLDTVCTSAMLFTRTDAGSRLIDKLADELSLNLDKIAPPAR